MGERSTAVRWVLIGVILLVGLPALVALVGSLLPRAHSASRHATFHQSPETLWRVLTDRVAMPSWRTDLRAIERLPDLDGHEVWQETDRRGHKLRLHTVEAVPPRRLGGGIADPKLPFCGCSTH